MIIPHANNIYISKLKKFVWITYKKRRRVFRALERKPELAPLKPFIIDLAKKLDIQPFLLVKGIVDSREMRNALIEKQWQDRSDYARKQAIELKKQYGEHYNCPDHKSCNPPVESKNPFWMRSEFPCSTKEINEVD